MRWQRKTRLRKAQEMSVFTALPEEHRQEQEVSHTHIQARVRARTHTQSGTEAGVVTKRVNRLSCKQEQNSDP